MTAPLKLTLLLAAIAIGYAQLADRVSSFMGESTDVAGLIVYGGLFALCLGGIAAAAFNRRGLVRWSYAALFALASLMVGSYQLIVNEHMSYDAFINMVSAGASFHEAWAQHGTVMLVGLAESVLLLLGIGLPHRLSVRWNGWWLAPLPLLVIALVTAMMFQRGGEGGRGLPPSYIGAAYGTFYAGELLASDRAERQPVTLPNAEPVVDGDIVLIVDESIAPQYLDINHTGGVSSGLLDPQSDAAIHNFGLAAAISHCSASVNQTLRFGGTRNDYRRINAVMPSIWAYARQAGYETVYIDAQREGGVYNNLMDAAEMEQVDRWIQYDDVPIVMRDHAAAEEIAAMSRDGQRQFIFLNKVGAHFPIHDKFPDEYARYRPMVERGKFADIADTGSREGFAGDADAWRRYRNSYRNTLLWNVGAFFDALLGEADLEAVTIIYTADHGQNLHENGEPGLNTHCSPEPGPAEGAVPLVVIGNDQAEGFDWAVAAGRDQPTSHYRIFPTLLGLMGYSRAEVAAIYGEDLLSPNADPFTFNSRFNARLGRKPQWVVIDPAQIPAPPVSDYASE